jgi:hypothetical protein
MNKSDISEMFSYSKLLFQLDVDHCRDRYALYGVKRYFESAFIEASCRLQDRYAVEAVFAQNLSNDPSALRRYQKPPLPFAFHIPLLSTGQEKSERVEILLAVAGNANNHLPIFMLAMELALDKLGTEISSSFKIAGKYSAGNDGQKSELNSRGEGLLLLTLPECFGLSSAVRVEFQSPLRLLREGKLIRRVSFPDILRALMRRISSIAYYYGEIEMDLDFKSLVERSHHVITVDESLSVERLPQFIEGMTGYIVFEGAFIDFASFLLIGEEFNLGKGSSYGAGCYKVSSYTASK